MPSKLSQSNVIFFCLFFAFLVFITTRGELPKYLNVLFTTIQSGGSSSGGGTSSTTGTGIPGIGSIGNAIDQATGSNVIGQVVTSFRNALPSIPSLPSIGSWLGSSFGGSFF